MCRHRVSPYPFPLSSHIQHTLQYNHTFSHRNLTSFRYTSLTKRAEPKKVRKSKLTPSLRIAQGPKRVKCNRGCIKYTHARIYIYIYIYFTSTRVPLEFFMSFKVCSESRNRVGCRKQHEASSPIHP